MAATLFVISYSPWSEKARWALDHHKVDYREKEYLPMLGEPALRLRLKRPFGKVSVPIFFDGNTVVEDSRCIAEHIDATRPGAESLFFDAAGCQHFATLSDVAASAGRARTTRTVLGDPEAQSDALEAFFPSALTKTLRPVARHGGRQLLRKYGAPDRASLIDALEETRRTLAGGDYLLGRFSFADIAMSSALEFIEPILFEHPPATAKAWKDPELAAEYEDLLLWRQRLRNNHR